MTLFSNLTGPAYAVLRIAFGVLFAFHGAQKLFGAFGGNQASSALMWVGGIVEFAGGLLVAVGLFTSVAALLCSGQMFVGYLMVHFGQGLIPIQNGGEKALLYAFGFLYIMARGSGIWSVDKQS